MMNKNHSKFTVRFFDVENPTVLPPLRCNGSKGSASTSKRKKNDYQPAKIVQEEFPLVDVKEEWIQNAEENEVISSLLSTKKFSYAKESGVQGYCKSFINDLIEFCKHEETLEIYDNLEVLDYDPDLWAVSINGFPYGVVEARRSNSNGASIMGDEKKFGQLLDYLNITRAFYGVKRLYGILTDYNEWRICWITESDPITERTIHCSPIYTRDSPLLARAIITYIVMIVQQSSSIDIGSIKLWDNSRPYVKFLEDKWIFASKPRDTQLTLVPPRKNSTDFYLLRDYYGGTDGRVWLAASNSGHICILKFLRDDENEEELIDQEINNWRAAGISTAFKCRLNRRYAMVLPYAYHCITSDDHNIPQFCLTLSKWSKYNLIVKHDDDEKDVLFHEEAMRLVQELKPAEVLQKCVETLAKNLMVQDDLEWRHVAVLPVIENGVLQSLVPIFIDLGRVRKVDSVEAAEMEMLSAKLELLSIF